MVLSTFFTPFRLFDTVKTPRRGILRRFQDWQDYCRLAGMEDHILRDIGLTREQVYAARQLWDAPEIWRKR